MNKLWINTLQGCLENYLDNFSIEEKSWQGEVVSQYAINQLPTNLLLNTAGRVEKINVTEEELDTFLKDVDKKEADKKKKRK